MRNRSRSSLRQRVHPLGFDRVLGRHDEERGRCRERAFPDRHLPLPHHLEHRRLHLGRRPVDLISEHEVRQYRSHLDVEPLLGRPVDSGTDDVGRNQVRRELDSAERATENPCHRAQRDGLAETGYAFEEAVTVGEQADHQPLQHPILADHDLAHLKERLFHLG